MNTYAHISSAAVVELFTPPDGFSIEQCFHAGLTWVDVSSVTPGPQPGWTATLTGAVWTFAPPPPPPGPTLAEQAASELATRIAAGIAITSTASPALDGSYALDDVSTAQIYQIGLYASQLGAFPSGGTTQAYPDAAASPHTFSVPQFVAFLRAVAPLVSALNTQAGIMAQGGVPAWPAQIAAIA